LKIAVQNMANAIKTISVQRGYDVTQYALVSFGGAGGQHACAIADTLGMTTVHLHPFSGLLSAYGMGLASIYASRTKAFVQPLADDSRSSLDALIDDLSDQVLAELKDQGVTDATHHPVLHLRYEGTDTTIDLDFSARDMAAIRTAFEAEHKAQFGFVYPGRTIIIESVELQGADATTAGRDETAQTTTAGEASRGESTRIFTDGKWHDAAIVRRGDVARGQTISGPAILVEDHQTVVIEPGWQAQLTARDHLVLKRVEAKARDLAIGTQADPVMLEVFNNLFMSIAEQMGETLQKTASSVNIKERLDFSCAVFDKSGALVANAPAYAGASGVHGPVGGSDHPPERRQGPPWRCVCPQRPLQWRHPPARHHRRHAGVRSRRARDHLLGRLARPPCRCRRHSSRLHDPLATSVEEEGVLFDNFKVVDQGIFQEIALRNLLTDHPYPCRNPEIRTSAT
jgi:5-oxoprolinase (ATP-hydrolysing)